MYTVWRYSRNISFAFAAVALFSSAAFGWVSATSTGNVGSIEMVELYRNGEFTISPTSGSSWDTIAEFVIYHNNPAGYALEFTTSENATGKSYLTHNDHSNLKINYRVSYLDNATPASAWGDGYPLGKLGHGVVITIHSRGMDGPTLSYQVANGQDRERKTSGI